MIPVATVNTRDSFALQRIFRSTTTDVAEQMHVYTRSGFMPPEMTSRGPSMTEFESISFQV